MLLSTVKEYLISRIRPVFVLMLGQLKDNTGEYTFKIGKTAFTVNDIFPEKGKTLEERLVDLILYEIENGKGSGKKETGAEEPIPER